MTNWDLYFPEVGETVVGVQFGASRSSAELVDRLCMGVEGAVVAGDVGDFGGEMGRMGCSAKCLQMGFARTV